MSVPTGIFSLLQSAAGVTSLLGSGDSLRVYPAMIPQGVALPALRYNRISGPFERSLAGPTTFAEATYQLDVVDDVYADAMAAADAVRIAMDGYSGVPVSGERFWNIILDNMGAPFETPPDASEQWRWIISMDFRIFFKIATS